MRALPRQQPQLPWRAGRASRHPCGLPPLRRITCPRSAASACAVHGGARRAAGIKARGACGGGGGALAAGAAGGNRGGARWGGLGRRPACCWPSYEPAHLCLVTPRKPEPELLPCGAGCWAACCMQSCRETVKPPWAPGLAPAAAMGRSDGCSRWEGAQWEGRWVERQGLLGTGQAQGALQAHGRPRCQAGAGGLTISM